MMWLQEVVVWCLVAEGVVMFMAGRAWQKGANGKAKTLAETQPKIKNRL